MSLLSTELSILLIVTISAAGIVGGAVYTVTNNVSNDIENKGDTVSKSINEDIQIINDIGSGFMYDSGSNKLRIYVRNTGDSVIDKDSITLFVNGRITQIDSIDPENDNQIIREDEYALIKATVDVSGRTYVKVSTDDGAESNAQFYE